MRIKAVVARWSGCALWLIACTGGQSGAPGDGQAGGTSVETPCSATACEAQLSDMLERDLGPRATPRPQLTRSACVYVAAEQGLEGEACQCSDDDSGFHFLGPRAADCLVYGHGGACLWHGSDMPEQCDDETCEAACAELQDRFAADDRIAYSFMVRYAACVNNRCESVAEIGERCYAASELSWSQGRDCSLSSSQIIELARENTGEGSTTACDEAAECGNAYGCRDGICLWCNDDAQCAAGEDCVNANCLLTASIQCRSDDDCDGAGELCLLFGVEGVSAAPGRGNADLRAECAVPE